MLEAEANGFLTTRPRSRNWKGPCWRTWEWKRSEPTRDRTTLAALATTGDMGRTGGLPGLLSGRTSRCAWPGDVWSFNPSRESTVICE